MKQSQSNSSLHGVFLKVFETGVLITGAPGIGKSDLALSLINRGHTLIADDCVLIEIENDRIIGQAPSNIKGFLYLHNIGPINIIKHFTQKAFCEKSFLDMHIQLTKTPASDPLPEHSSIKMLNKEIPSHKLDNICSRPTEILVETLVQSFLLEKNGYNANLEFKKQIAKA
jgi:HPr kinase/phosphorylase